MFSERALDLSTARSLPYEVFLPWLERRWLVNGIETIKWRVGTDVSSTLSFFPVHPTNMKVFSLVEEL